MHNFVAPVLLGIFVGLIARVMFIQKTYRQFPSRPHGMIIHLFLAFVASLIGALLIPAIFKPDFTAGVFVSIGTAQFHTMRSLERDTWRDIDKGEPVPRGDAYIDSIAASFEARLFLVIGIAAVTTIVSYLVAWPIGALCGLTAAFIGRIWRQGKRVAEMADVACETATIRNGVIYVANRRILTMHQHDAEETPGKAKNLLAVVVKPKDLSGVLTFAHAGQQQAVLHNLCTTVGVNLSVCPPTAAYFPDDEKLGLVLVLSPLVHNSELAVKTVGGAPLLESVIRHSVSVANM